MDTTVRVNVVNSKILGYFKKKKKKKKTELKTFFGNNVSKVCLKQLKLSDHIKLDKWNMFAFSNL